MDIVHDQQQLIIRENSMQHCYHLNISMPVDTREFSPNRCISQSRLAQDTELSFELTHKTDQRLTEDVKPNHTNGSAKFDKTFGTMPPLLLDEPNDIAHDTFHCDILKAELEYDKIKLPEIESFELVPVHFRIKESVDEIKSAVFTDNKMPISQTLAVKSEPELFHGEVEQIQRSIKLEEEQVDGCHHDEREIGNSQNLFDLTDDSIHNELLDESQKELYQDLKTIESSSQKKSNSNTEIPQNVLNLEITVCESSQKEFDPVVVNSSQNVLIPDVEAFERSHLLKYPDVQTVESSQDLKPDLDTNESSQNMKSVIMPHDEQLCPNSQSVLNLDTKIIDRSHAAVSPTEESVENLYQKYSQDEFHVIQETTETNPLIQETTEINALIQETTENKHLIQQTTEIKHLIKETTEFYPLNPKTTEINPLIQNTTTIYPFIQELTVNKHLIPETIEINHLKQETTEINPLIPETTTIYPLILETTVNKHLIPETTEINPLVQETPEINLSIPETTTIYPLFQETTQSNVLIQDISVNKHLIPETTEINPLIQETTEINLLVPETTTIYPSIQEKTKIKALFPEISVNKHFIQETNEINPLIEEATLIYPLIQKTTEINALIQETVVKKNFILETTEIDPSIQETTEINQHLLILLEKQENLSSSENLLEDIVKGGIQETNITDHQIKMHLIEKNSELGMYNAENVMYSTNIASGHGLNDFDGNEVHSYEEFENNLTQVTKGFSHQRVRKDYLTETVAQFVNDNNVLPQEGANDHGTEIYVPKMSQLTQDVKEPNPGDQLCDLVKTGESVARNVDHSIDCIQNEINSHVLDQDEIREFNSKSLFVTNHCDKTEIYEHIHNVETENLSSDQVIEVGVNFSEHYSNITEEANSKKFLLENIMNEVEKKQQTVQPPVSVIYSPLFTCNENTMDGDKYQTTSIPPVQLAAKDEIHLGNVKIECYDENMIQISNNFNSDVNNEANIHSDCEASSDIVTHDNDIKTKFEDICAEENIKDLDLIPNNGSIILENIQDHQLLKIYDKTTCLDDYEMHLNCRDNTDVICNENDKTFHNAQTDTFQNSIVGSQEQVFAKGSFKMQENALLDDEEHSHEDMIGMIATDQTLNTDSLIKCEDAVIYEVMNEGYENKIETIVFDEAIKTVANLGCGNSSENFIDTKIVVDAVKQDANLEDDFSTRTNGNENIITSAIAIDEVVKGDVNLGCENNESHDMKNVTAVSKERNTNTTFGNDCDMKDMKNTVDFDTVKESLNFGCEEINNDNLTEVGEKGLKEIVLGCENFVIDAIPIDEAANRNVIPRCKDGMVPTAFLVEVAKPECKEACSNNTAPKISLEDSPKKHISVYENILQDNLFEQNSPSSEYNLKLIEDEDGSESFAIFEGVENENIDLEITCRETLSAVGIQINGDCALEVANVCDFNDVLLTSAGDKELKKLSDETEVINEFDLVKNSNYTSVDEEQESEDDIALHMETVNDIVNNITQKNKYSNLEIGYEGDDDEDDDDNDSENINHSIQAIDAWNKNLDILNDAAETCSDVNDLSSTCLFGNSLTLDNIGFDEFEKITAQNCFPDSELQDLYEFAHKYNVEKNMMGSSQKKLDISCAQLVPSVHDCESKESSLSPSEFSALLNIKQSIGHTPKKNRNEQNFSAFLKHVHDAKRLKLEDEQTMESTKGMKNKVRKDSIPHALPNNNETGEGQVNLNGNILTATDENQVVVQLNVETQEEMTNMEWDSKVDNTRLANENKIVGNQDLKVGCGFTEGTMLLSSNFEEMRVPDCCKKPNEDDTPRKVLISEEKIATQVMKTKEIGCDSSDKQKHSSAVDQLLYLRSHQSLDDQYQDICMDETLYEEPPAKKVCNKPNQGELDDLKKSVRMDMDEKFENSDDEMEHSEITLNRKWKYAHSVHMEDPPERMPMHAFRGFAIENQSIPALIPRLMSCKKPIRLGLSRKHKGGVLHNNPLDKH